jgi:hypothetical protein
MSAAECVGRRAKNDWDSRRRLLWRQDWCGVIDLLKIAIYRQFDEQETGQVTWETWFRPLDPQHGRLGKYRTKVSRFTPDSVRVLLVVLAQCAVRQA